MYTEALQQAFRLGYSKIRELKNDEGRNVIKKGVASGDLHNDREIKADRILGELYLEYFSSLKWCGATIIEGLDPEYHCNTANSKFVLVAIDPLDASLDFEKAKATDGFPYSVAITIALVTAGDDIFFNDILAAGVMDYRTGANWVADKNRRTRVARTLDSKQEYAITAKEDLVNLGSQIIVADMYYPQTRSAVMNAFGMEKGYLRNPGSAAYEMACVSDGSVNAQISLSQKHHELGAAYKLISGAGGFVINPYKVDKPFCVNIWASYNKRAGTYDWNHQTPVVCAGTKHYGLIIVNKLYRYI